MVNNNFSHPLTKAINNKQIFVHIIKASTYNLQLNIKLQIDQDIGQDFRLSME